MSLCECLYVDENGEGGVLPSLLACLCPCVPFGIVASRIPGARCGAPACCAAYVAAELAATGCGGGVLQMLLRQQFHQRVLHEHESCPESCLLGCCCCCCGIVQMQKQLRARERLAGAVHGQGAPAGAPQDSAHDAPEVALLAPPEAWGEPALANGMG